MKFFSRDKEPSDPAIIVSRCLKFLVNRITDDLTGEGYCWRKPWGVKRFECMVLSKFILDYSFEQIVKDQLSENEKIGYYLLSNQTFSSMFNAEFSKVGMSFEDMKEEIQNKVKAYITALGPDSQPPECYHQIYMLITGSLSREELEKEATKKTAGLEIMRNNEYFAPMVTQYEDSIKYLKEQIVALDMIDIILPHMIRSARQKVKSINLNKIKSLSKKIAKKDNNK